MDFALGENSVSTVQLGCDARHPARLNSYGSSQGAFTGKS